MKWWYLLVLVLGVVIGWWLLQTYGVKRATPVATISEGTIEKEVSRLPTMVIDNNEGKKTSVVEIDGVVRNWNPETGLIEFMSGKKIWKLTIDPTKAIVFTPSVTRREQIFMITDRNDVQWASAFCVDDPIDVRLNGSKLVAISNGGYRVCGFKGQ